MQWDEGLKIKSDSVRGRKHSASDLLHNVFYMQGGLDTKGDWLGDMHQFKLDNMEWEQMELIKTSKISIENIKFHRSNHTMCSSDKGKRVFHYIFGGLNEQNLAVNSLFLLSHKKDEHKVKVKELIDAKGKMPLARSHHSSLLIC